MLKAISQNSNANYPGELLYNTTALVDDYLNP
jgi:hypothetical protein